MNMKTRSMFKRVSIITLILMLLVATLVSCGGTKTTPKLNVGKITLQYEENSDTPLNSFSAGDSKLIAEMLAGAYTAEYNTQALLISAANGYGVTDKYKDQSVSDKGLIIDNENVTNVTARLDYVKDFLKEANTKSSAPLDKSLFNKIDTINAADVRTLIDCFKLTVTPTDAGLIDNILLGIGIAVGWITENICFGSYLAGICVFAIIIEILMLPFAIKQQKNSIRQAKLRPKEMAIRNKYKGRTDQATMQKMQAEIQEFYQREHYSPYSGCLSLLIQLPIIIALYNIVINPLHYMLGQSNEVVTALTTYATASPMAGGAGMAYTAGSSTISLLSEIGKDASVFVEGLGNFEFFAIEESALASLGTKLSALPNFSVLGVNFGLTPSISAFNILLLVPVLTFAAYFVTSKLNRKFMYQPATNAGADERQVACSNTMMDVTMPLMSTFFTFMVPALVGVYWIFRSLIGLLKQFLLSKVMPLPVFTDEDYKAAEREMKGKQTSHTPKSGGNGVKAVRSLHYIDDEDFEDTRERGLARRAALEEKEREAQEKQAQKKALFSAPMKDMREAKEEKKEENSTDTDNKTEE